MKRSKKLVGLLLSLVMILAMSVTAFAEPDDQENKQDTHKYELYQIFTGDVLKKSEDDVIFSNVKWGENAKIPEGTKVGDPVPKEVLEDLTKVKNSKHDSEKLDVIKKYVETNSTPNSASAVPKEDGSVTYSGLTPGYYLVKDKDGSVTGNDVYTTYVVQVTDGTLTFIRKGDVPTVDKEIVEADVEKDANEASIGDTVEFKITGTLPSNIDDYKEYTYIFTDTLSEGLTYVENSVKVAVVNGNDSRDVTQYFYIEDPSTKENTLTVGISNLKTLENVTKESKIVVTYSATLNEKAVVGGTGNDNKVKLSYTNDPNYINDGVTESPVGETPEQTTTTYTTELTIHKTDENGKTLTGAEFTLSGSGVNVTVIRKDVYVVDTEGTYWKLKDGTYTTVDPEKDGIDKSEYENPETKYSKEAESTVVNTGTDTEKPVSAFVDADGKVTFSGLGAGTYTITETVTPAGYNTIEPVDFTIKFAYDEKTRKGTFSTDNEGIKVGENNTLEVTIENHSGSTLPSTGGVGTTIIYILGAILAVGAGVMLIARYRMGKEK